MAEQPWRSKPFGEQAIYLIEDHEKPEQRIYEIHDSRGHAVPLLGSEMASIVAWWAAEQKRPGSQHPTAR